MCSPAPHYPLTPLLRSTHSGGSHHDLIREGNRARGYSSSAPHTRTLTTRYALPVFNMYAASVFWIHLVCFGPNPRLARSPISGLLGFSLSALEDSYIIKQRYPYVQLVSLREITQLCECMFNAESRGWVSINYACTN